MPARPPFAFGPFVLDTAAARLTRGGADVELRPKAFALLAALAARAGELVTKDELLDAVWGTRFVTEGVIKTTVGELREALGDDPKAPRWIETVPRRGYRFAAAAPAAGGAGLAPSPPREDHPSAALVGRQAPLATLRRWWGEACGGQRRVVAVAGEPGVGKSALLAAFVATLDDARVAAGPCVEAWGGSEPYGPVLDALDRLCASEPALVEALRETAPTWLVQLPWRLAEADRAALRAQLAGASQDRMLRELAVLLERLTQERPLLLVLEDVHWADPATVQLLGALARRQAPAALMIVASFRPTEVAIAEHPFGDLRRELKLHRQLHELLLEGWSAEEVAALLRQRHGPACAEPGFVQQLHAFTEGLPLFVLGVLDDLVDEGLLSAPGEPARLAVSATQRLAVPQTLSSVIERQLERLPAPVRALLEAAALAAPEFDHPILADAMALPADTVREQLDSLVKRQIWLRGAGAAELPDGRVAMRCSFRHALIRHALAQRVGAAQRIELHRRLADALERNHGVRAGEMAAELALHRERGRQPRLAAQHLAAAARTALQRHASREALALAERGLALLASCQGEDAAAIAEARLPLASVRLTATLQLEGMASAAARAQVGELLAMAASLPVADDVLPLWQVLLLVHVTGRLDGTSALIASFAERARGASPAAQAVAANAQGIDALHAGRLVESAAHLERTLALMPHAGADVVLLRDPRAEAWAYLCLVGTVLGRDALAQRCGAEIDAMIERGTDLISTGMGRWFQVYAAYFRGDAAQVRALAGDCAALLEARGVSPFLQPHRLALGWARAALGDGDGGFALARDALQRYLAQGSRQGLAGLFAIVADAARLAGDLAAAGDLVREGQRHGAALGDGFARSELLRVQGAVAARLGDPAAGDVLREALALAGAQQAPLLVSRATATLEGR